ncbi:MAG: ABC transporter substrate-binding protein [Sphingomonas sp.]|nr:ABC transporter substrate-binding protein [Sphingomonas sp.]
MSTMRLLLPAVIGLALAAPAAAQTADPARAPVQALSDGLIGIMKGGAKLGFAGRAQQIGTVVDRSFDLALMVRLAVGPAWVQASPADRAALMAAFRRLTVSEYANNFDKWAGEAIAVDANVETRGTDKLVKTTLTAPREAPVSIAYRLRQNGAEWRIIDVFFKNSISQLATRRADFEAIVRSGGVRALVAHVNALADKAAR